MYFYICVDNVAKENRRLGDGSSENRKHRKPKKKVHVHLLFLPPTCLGGEWGLWNAFSASVHSSCNGFQSDSDVKFWGLTFSRSPGYAAIWMWNAAQVWIWLEFTNIQGGHHALYEIVSTHFEAQFFWSLQNLICWFMDVKCHPSSNVG